MENEQKDGVKLTIGIPTWNRSEEIGDAIDSILGQIDDRIRPELEILISDNASTDATQSVIGRYATHYPGLFSLRRNPQNIGFSRNVDMLFRHARGQYVLLLSDDDALEPDTLQEVFAVLEKHPACDAVFLQAWAYDGTLKHRTSTSKWYADGADKSPGASCSYFPSGVEFFHARGTLCDTCISGNMFRTAAWLRTDMTVGLLSGSIQLYAGMQILAQGSVCVIDKPLIKYRDGGGTLNVYLKTRGDGVNLGWPFIYFFDITKACKESKNVYPAGVYRAFYLTCVRGVFYTLLDVKAKNGAIDKTWFQERLAECFDPDCCGWLLGLHRFLLRVPWFLFIVPNIVYKIGRRIFYKLRF